MRYLIRCVVSAYKDQRTESCPKRVCAWNWGFATASEGLHEVGRSQRSGCHGQHGASKTGVGRSRKTKAAHQTVLW